MVVVGEIDMASGSALLDVLHSAIDGASALDPPATALHLDLQGVGFIDSSGLKVLLGARQRCDACGLLVRVQASATVARLFAITGVAHLFPES